MCRDHLPPVREKPEEFDKLRLDQRGEVVRRMADQKVPEESRVPGALDQTKSNRMQPQIDRSSLMRGTVLAADLAFQDECLLDSADCVAMPTVISHLQSQHLDDLFHIGQKLLRLLLRGRGNLARCRACSTSHIEPGRLRDRRRNCLTDGLIFGEIGDEKAASIRNPIALSYSISRPAVFKTRMSL
jgi:hypothetical protein